MSWIKNIFFVALMMVSSAHFVKIYAKSSEGSIKCEQVVLSGFSNRINISNAIGIKPLKGIDIIQASPQNDFVFWDFNVASQDSENNFGNQQLKTYCRHLLKRFTRVKKKNNKLSKANFQSYAGNKDDLIQDKITIQIPSRLVSNLEGYKIQFERFCSIEITPD